MPTPGMRVRKWSQTPNSERALIHEAIHPTSTSTSMVAMKPRPGMRRPSSAANRK